MPTEFERQLISTLGTRDLRKALDELVRHGPASVDAILSLMQNEWPVFQRTVGGPSVAQAAVIISGRIGEPALPVLAKYAQQPSTTIRRTVAAAIRDMPPSTTAAELGKQLANDSDAQVRAAAITSLLGQGSLAEQELLRHLDDQSPEVRAASCAALSKLSKVSTPFMRLLYDTDPRVQAAAAEALGKLHVTDAVDPLIDLLQDTKRYGFVRMSAAVALGKLKATRAVPILKTLAAASADYEFQRAMYGAIEDITA